MVGGRINQDGSKARRISDWIARARLFALSLLIGLVAVGCVAEGRAQRSDVASSAPPSPNATSAIHSGPSTIRPTQPVGSPTSTAEAAPTSPPGTTADPTPDENFAPTEQPTPTIWPTVTRQILPADVAAGLEPCDRRTVDDDWLIVATQQFGLPETYVPADLVPLSDYFPIGVTVGIESSIRARLIEPLRRIIDDMHAASLAPSILSGYRSYSEQYLAWKWWNSQYPERVAVMSARAGYSEHQLGTTIDFGSPALNHLFHVDFAGTPEGLWLTENAHRYGFTMSYPVDTYDVTGFKYEPWHFRYVGVELSTELHETGRILTEWQLANLPPPCIP